MNTNQILTHQIADQILDRQWLLVRAQQPQATDYNAPAVPADWLLLQIHDNVLCDSRGRQLSRPLSAADLESLTALRALDPNSWSEEDFWAQYAREFDLHETHTNTDPVILCLPAQPHPTFGGKSTTQQFTDFIAQYQ